MVALLSVYYENDLPKGYKSDYIDPFPHLLFNHKPISILFFTVITSYKLYPLLPAFAYSRLHFTMAFIVTLLIVYGVVINVCNSKF